MELEEAKKVIKFEIDFENFCMKVDHYASNEKLKKIVEAIETLLQELDRLQKENEELSCVKKAIKVYKTNVGTENCQFILMSEKEFLNSFNYKCLLDDYISKDKIREKIEEIKLPHVCVGGRSRMKTLNYGKTLGKMEVLHDLLKEE